MASISDFPMASTQSLSASGTKNIFLILGLVCILGFFADITTISLPWDPMALEWRLGFMQQVNSRMIVLFLGTAFLLYSLIGRSSLVRYLALGCLIAGILLQLSCVLVIRDNLVLQKQAIDNIENQTEQLQAQIQASASNSDLPANVTPEQLQEASAQIEAQAETLRERARSRGTKSMVSIAGGLSVMGIGMIGLGRFGVKRST